MKQLLFLLPVLMLLFSCKDKNKSDDPQTLALTIATTWGADPLYMTERKAYSTGDTFFIDRFSTYLSDITLISESGEVKVQDIAYVDFSDVLDENGAIAGKTILIPNVPARHYTGIKMGLGVSPLLNANAPATYPATNPLSKTSEYWDGWQSYIFSRFEGRLDAGADGTFDRVFVYHTGSDAVYRTTSSYALDLHVEEVQANLILEIDLQKLVDSVDISAVEGTHTLGSLELSNQIMDNFKNSAIRFK